MDIVEQFREQQRIAEQKRPPFIPDHDWLSWGDAADEIERLREEVAKITKDRDRHSGMVIDLLDKYFDSATIRTTGGKG
jgi:hypothetical protein